MTIREEREVRAPPAMVLAALGTAAENLGWSVRDLRVREGLLVATSGAKVRGASLGFIVTARARRIEGATHLSIDATPILGSWARKSADHMLQALVHEYQLVMSAPQARIRRPACTHPDGPPFAARPQLLALAWVASAVLVFGVVVGGWWWVAASASLVGGALLMAPRVERWWSIAVVACTLLSLPLGVFGAVARRMALANLLWTGSQLT